EHRRHRARHRGVRFAAQREPRAALHARLPAARQSQLAARHGGLARAMTRRTICCFCGAREGKNPKFKQAAAALGASMARRGLSLVYGGGSQGMMGTVADAVLAAGGQVTGVIPHGLARREFAHAGLTTMHRVDTMHERKALMERLSDAFVA